MKKTKTLLMAMSVILMGSLLLTCQKESDTPLATDNEVAFAINISNLKSATQLKSSMDYNLADADKIILTIQNSDGSPTKYTDAEVKIEQMNGIYYTKKIVLKTGNYKLTDFAIIDQADSTIFVSPLTGSQEAQNVSSPLPVAFSVAKDITTPVNVEVLSTEKKTPEDFGLNRFPIIEVKTFGFMIGVADIESDKLLTAKLTVSNGSYSYVQNLDSITNNVVTVKDGLSNYTLKVEKSGYNTYTHTYPIDSIKMFRDSIGNLPLIIELEKVNELTVTDIDGNVYHTVTIGTQVWMIENLKTTHYSDGSAIPNVTDGITWRALTTPAYCWYNNDATNYKATYGALYNWFSVDVSTNGNKNVCPTGWHVPNGAEWTTLVNYLGGWSVAGGKMKEIGTTHWTSPNIGATNESDFTLLPGGACTDHFTEFGINGHYWSTSNSFGIWAWEFVGFNNQINILGQENVRQFGFSIRCIKD